MSHQIEIAEDIKILTAFMQGPDQVTFGRMIGYFSVPGKYLHPRELMRFRNSMTDEEWIDFKAEFWDHMHQIRMVETARLKGKWSVWEEYLRPAV